MSCDFHKGPCDCWAPHAQQQKAMNNSASLCNCLGLSHSPGCRYYAIQEADRISQAHARSKEVAEKAYRYARDPSTPWGVAERAVDAMKATAQKTETHLEALRRRRATYLTYVRDRIEDEDWHGVSDAANDLRELDCEIRCVEAGLPEKPRHA